MALRTLHRRRSPRSSTRLDQSRRAPAVEVEWVLPAPTAVAAARERGTGRHMTEDARDTSGPVPFRVEFTADAIDDLAIHFLHVRSPHPHAMPLVLTPASPVPSSSSSACDWGAFVTTTTAPSAPATARSSPPDRRPSAMASPTRRSASAPGSSRSSGPGPTATATPTEPSAATPSSTTSRSAGSPPPPPPPPACTGCWARHARCGACRHPDGRVGWVTRASGSQAISTGTRVRSREWARAIYRAHPHLVGLAYRSSVWGPGRCAVLWERAERAFPKTPSATRTLDDPALAIPIATPATKLGTFAV